ncbi:allantoate amidohydrolase [Nakamurella multipartita]|jgi:N-carbamoyl-L-amino-acid hydrolase|uniref:Amidase, hydantoinase/carbamoylase family n=1 Tax=Nakamurella multipartita (strain ATCC 700099 / DSM 44233 / CIP 104796 / JCM 9543 / NBRC 105858 / Y-104) TaxID=479431 RepID=C8XEG5_NAKMY|nr:amidase, hydantoinase/carbamoylase family [Nakamurella multipartita DSM 44233]
MSRENAVRFGPTPGDGSRFASAWSDLAGIGRDQLRGGFSRHVFDDAEMQLRAWFVEQAQRRGLEVENDRNGNVWAWWGAPAPGAVVTGSHLDSVPGGGAFDGPLGVVSGLLAVDELRLRGVTPDRPLAIACFMEEEGGRFGLPCLGSRLLTGAVDPDHVRRLHDADGVSVADAARRVGFDPSTMGPDPARLASIGTFVELHIEQGRLLRSVDPLAVIGVASEIVAHGRWRITVSGQGNHAGTTAVADRHDPMIPAAAAVLAARRVLSGFEGAVATIGRITPVPGGTNVIASSVALWLDVRHTDALVTAAIVDAIVAEVRAEAAAEGCTVMVQRESMSDQVAFDPGLGLEISGRLGAPVIPTAAGHDAGVFAAHVPTAMVFVRNPAGVSHAPDEHADADDCAVGVQALATVLETLLT